MTLSTLLDESAFPPRNCVIHYLVLYSLRPNRVHIVWRVM